MRGKNIKYVLGVVVLLALGFGVGRWAAAGPTAAVGTLDSPGPPGSTYSYTLEDIYNRLNDGTAGTQSAFTEPASGPTEGTGHTLDEICDLIGEPAPVPKTGQTTSYGTGDDGALRKGVAWPSPRFITSTAGIVTDTLTGLIWLQNANCFGARDWSTALSDANGLGSGSCGLSDGSSAGDWRLPNVRELQSLIDYSQYNPALPSDHPFTGVQSSYYWSSATRAGSTPFAWGVDLYGGDVYGGSKAGTSYVWPVRGGQ